MDYKVELDMYSGPLDLLLHLVTRDELTIEKIPVARIADQFLAYLENLRHIDIEVAGDFLVMAARITEMKSRALLPMLTTEDEEMDSELLADESDLIQRLLEYRGFKDISRWLRGSMTSRSRIFPHGPFPLLEEEKPEEEPLLPEGVTVWDLFSAFLRIRKEVMLDEIQTVVYDDVPIEDHIQEILERIQRDGWMSFSHILPPKAGRLYIVGAFLALLELIRQKRIRVEQEEDFDHIRIETVSAEEAARLEALQEQTDRESAIRSSDVEGAEQPPPAESGDSAKERGGFVDADGSDAYHGSEGGT
jgi:segregation and condensation protein A